MKISKLQMENKKKILLLKKIRPKTPWKQPQAEDH